MITVVELLRSAQLVIARTFEPFGPYLMAALLYWAWTKVAGIREAPDARSQHLADVVGHERP